MGLTYQLSFLFMYFVSLPTIFSPFLDKWIWAYFGFGLLGLQMLFRPRFKVPRGPLILFALPLWVLITWNFFRVDIRPQDPHIFYSWHFLFLGVLLLMQTSQPLERVKFFFWPLIGACALDRFFFFDPKLGLDSVWIFGNVNHAAQVVGFLGSLYWLRPHKGFFHCLAFAWTLTLAYHFHVRSVLIALAVVGIIEVLFYQGRRFRKWALVGGLTLVSVFAASSLDLANDHRSLGITGDSSVSERKTLLWATLEMIRENPWGVGQGRYQFAIVPYLSNEALKASESEVNIHPHNEFLRVAGEEGVLALALFGACWIAIFVLVIRSPRQLALFGFWTVEFLFQFPLYIAPSAALFCAYIADLHKTRFVWSNWGFVVLALSVPLLVFSNQFYQTIRVVHEPEAFIAQCESYPANWRNCLRGVETLMGKGEDEKAMVLLARELERNPTNIFAYRYLGSLRIKEGRVREGCNAYWFYLKSVRGVSSLWNTYVNICSEMKLSEEQQEALLSRLKLWARDPNQKGSPPLSQELVK